MGQSLTKDPLHTTECRCLVCQKTFFEEGGLPILQICEACQVFYPNLVEFAEKQAKKIARAWYQRHKGEGCLPTGELGLETHNLRCRLEELLLPPKNKE